MQRALTVNKGPHLKLGHEMLEDTLLAFCASRFQRAPTVWQISAGLTAVTSKRWPLGWEFNLCKTTK